jgi:hypothetical protein
MARWTICVEPSFAADKAVMAAVEDLQENGRQYGLSFEVSPEPPATLAHAIIVGDATRNPVTARLVSQDVVRLEGATHPQAYEIRTCRLADGPLMVVAGGSLLGDVYGLYWVWDRMRVFGGMTDIDETRSPALPIRLAMVGDKAAIHNALRYTANWISGSNIPDLVPWDVEPEASRNAQNRRDLKNLIALAHDLHMKFLATSDEFSYHPALLQEFGATLDPADPALWHALQAKYRRLFRALPEVDGVQIRTGELTRVTGTYRAFDVMHGAPESKWTLEERYRTFVIKMHQVVVGEFDKIYFHRTWVTNVTEQHSDPEVYKRIFTDEVPTKNLYLSPYLSAADRWYYQPFNPTFNLTPHNMLVLLAHLDYHAAKPTDVFPSFPGQYHQEGLRTILAPSKSNVKGAHFGIPRESGWDTITLTAYTDFRLAWDPDTDLRVIAEDFASIYFGRALAPQMAEILLLSYQAYKDGIYIKPVAESLRDNTLPHLRCGTFVLEGIPDIDKGKAHIEWLKSSMYDPSKGRTGEAIECLARGRDAAVRMCELYRAVSPEAADAALARKVEASLETTRLLVETNTMYVRTCLAYFDYRDNPCEEKREFLARTVDALKSSRADFMRVPGFGYALLGIDQLIVNVDEALDDLARAEATLDAAPDEDGVRRAIETRQTEYANALDALLGEAVKFLRWRGRVDGRDLLSIRGETLTVKHIQWDHLDSVEYQFFEGLPDREVTVLIRDVESRPSHPFVLEQPTKENDFTVKVYLWDQPKGGYGWWEFELYYVDKSPDEIGLTVPW